MYRIIVRADVEAQLGASQTAQLRSGQLTAPT